MNTVCPHCGSRFEVDEAWLNHQADCPSCGKYFLITNDAKPVLKPIFTPVGEKKANPSPVAAAKKDLLFFWVTFPIFYFIYIVLWIYAKNYSWQEIVFMVFFGFGLLFLSEVVMMAEIGIKSKKELVFRGLLLYILFPIGFISYAELRKTSGLSNITPWAVISSIVIGLTLFLIFGMAWS